MKNLLKELKKDLSYCPETGVFTWLVNRSSARVGTVAGSLSTKGYIRIRHQKVRYPAHRLAWLFMTGSFPKDQLDHINHIKHDNRFCNLRECNNSQNSHNKKQNNRNTSGFQGVSAKRKKFSASICCNYKIIYLGVFNTKTEAAIAYNKKALELYGEFAYQNIIPSP